MNKNAKATLGSCITALTFLLMGEPESALAAGGARTQLVDEIQLESHNRIGYEDVVWIRLNGSWSGLACGADWGWFNAKENPQFLATALTAQATGRPPPWTLSASARL